MSRALSRGQNLHRSQGMTPREFEQHLAGHGLKIDDIHQLTRLFEQVRYGGKTPAPRAEREAIHCLSANREPLRQVNMSRHRLPWLLILAVAVLFAPLCRSFTREVVIIPLLYLFWLAKFLFDAVPQVIIWPFFIAILFVILITGFIDRRHSPRQRTPPPDQAPQRVAEWMQLIEQAQQDDYFKWRLGQNFQRLALRLLAQHRHQSLAETRRQLRRGEIDLPPDVLAYFQASLKPLGYLATPRRWQFWKQRQPSPLHLEPGRVVAVLEGLNEDEI